MVNYQEDYLVVRQFEGGYWAGVLRMKFGKYRLVLAHDSLGGVTVDQW